MVRLTPSTATAPFGTAVGRKRLVKRDGQPVSLALVANARHHSSAVYMTLNKVSTEAGIGSHRALEIHQLSRPHRTERRHPQRFRAYVRKHLLAFNRRRRQADAINREAVARAHLHRQCCTDTQPDGRCNRLHLFDVTDSLNQAGEHNLQSVPSHPRAAGPSARRATQVKMAGPPARPARRRANIIAAATYQLDVVHNPGIPGGLVQHRATFDQNALQAMLPQRLSTASAESGPSIASNVAPANSKAFARRGSRRTVSADVTIITGPAERVEKRRASGVARKRRSNTTRVSGRSRKTSRGVSNGSSTTSVSEPTAIASTCAR